MIRNLRFLSQAAFFALSLAVFFGLAAWPSAAAFQSATQIMPALSGVRWLDLPRFWPVLGLLFVLPLLAGRLYCSWYCPVGFLQDAAGRLAKALRFSAKPADGRSALRYFAFGLAWALLLSGSAAFHFLDHSSSLGSLYGLLGLAWAQRSFDAISGHGTVFALVLLAVPLVRARWFCAALCPTGCAFMLMRRWALFKTRTGPGCAVKAGGRAPRPPSGRALAVGCAACGACSRACPVRCVDEGSIDESRCVDCLECVSECRSGYLAYSLQWPWQATAPKPEPDPVDLRPTGRRRFLIAAGAVAVGALTGRRLRAGILSFPPGEPRDGIPPGGRSADEFYSRCVACGTCASVCPTRILAQKGASPLAGMGQARMDYGSLACSYECNACLAVCPSGALSYFPPQVKKRIKIGSSILKKERCIPIAHGRDCAACHERCPTGAISMAPHQKVRKPKLDDDYCIGCGACEAACPVQPEKAIVVRPRRLHSFAFIPRPSMRKAVGLQDIPRPEDDAFPF
ncbi:MAG: 4Fe-4S binding protein [Elusimicrobia bacterium]|nr:4Fe-4S binding protein [Elusimicrobiota bacterium]